MSKFSCVFFWATTPIKLKVELHICGGVLTNSKPPGPIIIMDELEILSLSQVQFITLVFGGAHNCVSPFTNRSKLYEFGAAIS
jgi:hypothetical protein